MGPVQATKTCLRKYATFSGRASRSEFWWFVGFTTFVTILIQFFDGTIFDATIFSEEFEFTPITELFCLAVLLPSLAVTSRRYQDFSMNSKPWMIAIIVSVFLTYIDTAANLSSFAQYYNDTDIYCVAVLLNLAFFLVTQALALPPSPPGPNQYGPNPNEVPQ